MTRGRKAGAALALAATVGAGASTVVPVGAGDSGGAGVVLAPPPPEDGRGDAERRSANSSKRRSATRTVRRQEPEPFGLADLFEVGARAAAGRSLLRDENEDGVPDRLGAAIVAGRAPTLAARAAAAEIAARLGFETTALDLPLPRVASPGRVAVLVGRPALAEAGLSPEDFGVEPLVQGEGAVAVAETGSPARRWVAVFGADEDGLLRAARLVAGQLPHVGSLSGPSLAEIGLELTAGAASDTLGPAARDTAESAAPSRNPPTASAGSAAVPEPGTHRSAMFPTSPPAPELGARGSPASTTAPLGAAPARPTIVFTRAVAEPGGAVRLGGIVRPGAAGPAATQAWYAELRELAAARRRAPDSQPDSASLRFRRLASIALSYADDEIVLPTLAATPPGPVPGRPGTAAKKALDLSNTYSTDGFLGDSDDNEIPDRVDVAIVPSEGAEIVGLAARIGLESAGLVVPLVLRSSELGPLARRPTTVLVGAAHPLVAELADSGKVALADVPPGHGLLELVPEAFGGKPSLVATGPDSAGAALAARRLAQVFPHVAERGDGLPVFDDAERDLWAFLSGRLPAGQAAAALYKLDRIAADLAAEDLVRADVLVSLDDPDPGLADVVARRAAALGADEAAVEIDNRDVERAATIFKDTFQVPSEVDRFWSAFEARVLGRLSPGARVEVEARLSEPPAVRRKIEDEAERRLLAAGASPESKVLVLSAFKQGLSWLRESVVPRLRGSAVAEIVVEFLRNDPPPEWPQQAIHTPVRWLHELFPADELLAADLGIETEQIRFEMTDSADAVYRVRAVGPAGAPLLEDAFDPVWVLRPYFDRFRDYEQVRVTTGWFRAVAHASVAAQPDTLANERILTDPEWFWDRFQARTLPAVYDYVMDRHDGAPRGGGLDAPLFGSLVVELEMSEPDYRLGVDNEIASTMDALHEEIYFGTIEFFQLIGRNARGPELTYPGRVVPVMRPRGHGGPGQGRIAFTGFATNRPAVVVRYTRRDGTTGRERLDVPKIAMERPSLRRAVVAPESPRLSRLDFRVRVDTELDERASHLALAPPEQVDERMISAEQVAAVLANLAELREHGLYTGALAYDEVGDVGVWAEWTHRQDPESRTAATLPANGSPAAHPSWADLLPDGWTYDGGRVVQWDEPIPPDEGHQMMAKLSRAFEHATMYRVGESYLGRAIWAMDLMTPVAASHWSRAKATTFKPTALYSARQHANEVSSTSHVLRHAELLLADSAQRRKLNKVNVVVHPFTNPDGAQLAYDLYRVTPDYILHAGYLGALGVDATSGADEDFPIYPEARVRGRLWRSWLPDVFLNPHGYPSHQVVQLFSEYSGLVRRGRVTERNWGFNKGWFMPGFGYVDDPSLPRHKDAAFRLRGYITAAINSNRDVFEMNQRNYARYRRYGAAFDPDVFRLPMTDSVLIEMPLKGSRAGGEGRRLNPKVTIWSGVTEAPDETAHGEWLELVAKAGLSWDQAVLDYLHAGAHQVERSGSEFFGGKTLKMTRPRPPKDTGPAQTPVPAGDRRPPAPGNPSRP